MKPLTDGQLAKFWEQVETRPSIAGTALALIASTGARPIEILGLTWEDWDGNDQIAVPTAKRRGADYRLLRLNPVAVRILRRHRAWYLSRIFATEQMIRTRPMFSRPGHERAISTRALRAMAKKIGRAMGYPGFHPYDLRHTMATRIVQQYGVADAQAILAHRSPKTTLRYAHAVPQRTTEASNLLLPPDTKHEDKQRA